MIIKSNYRAPLWVLGKHAETILPSLFRRVTGVTYLRERIFTPDGDFLDLDWSCHFHKRLAILSHGLEGSSQMAYMRGMTKQLNAAGWDSLAWNYRGCSGEPNHLKHFYHAASADDLKLVIQHAISSRRYSEIVLIGFSMGGILTLKYLGDLGSRVPSQVTKGICFSTPTDLGATIQSSSSGYNRIYRSAFLESLKEKVIEKAKTYPELLIDTDLADIQSCEDYDSRFTVPLHGFLDVNHYYKICNSNRLIPHIRTQTHIVNAKNDPFLTKSCFPVEECRENKYVHLEIPKNGGHLGFMLKTINGPYYSEKRALEILA